VGKEFPGLGFQHSDPDQVHLDDGRVVKQYNLGALTLPENLVIYRKGMSKVLSVAEAIMTITGSHIDLHSLLGKPAFEFGTSHVPGLRGRVAQSVQDARSIRGRHTRRAHVNFADAGNMACVSSLTVVPGSTGPDRAVVFARSTDIYYGLPHDFLHCWLVAAYIVGGTDFVTHFIMANPHIYVEGPATPREFNSMFSVGIKLGFQIEDLGSFRSGYNPEEAAVELAKKITLEPVGG